MEKATYEEVASISEPHEAMDVREDTNRQDTNPYAFRTHEVASHRKYNQEQEIEVDI